MDHYYIYYFVSFSRQRLLMVFYWSLRDSESPEISRTILSFLADLNSAVVWMVSIRPLISKSSSPCTKSLVTVPSERNIIGIAFTFTSDSLFSPLARSRYSCLFPFSFIFPQCSAGQAKSTIQQVLFFFRYHLA